MEIDNQTIVSDLTDSNDIDINMSTELEQKLVDIRIILENKLNELNTDGLKDKCKELLIVGISKLKKNDLVSVLVGEFNKLCILLRDKKANELKSICKLYNIKLQNGSKKDAIILNILQYQCNNLKFKIDDSSSYSNNAANDKGKQTNENKVIENKISTIEELEKQRQEIELKMKEEIERQKRIDEELKRLAEEDRKQAEEQKKKEKEEAKKKKQSIPKQVRVIVWNHYIGEDIIKHKCLCCKKVTITNTNFDVGHVLSEKNGGTHEINNLRPICGACNHSMGSENMVDFVVKYGLYIG
jgi:5-methylcytosine-specific restriction endonuclease McrA